MGNKVDKVESGWRVEITVTERKQTRTVDSYEGTTVSVRDEVTEHVVMSITANSKDEAIGKAMNHLNSERSVDFDDPTSE